MSNSDWYAVIAFVGIIIFCLASAALVSDWNSSRGIFHYHNAQQNTYNTHNEYCGVSSEARNPSAQAANGDKQKRYDLCQQWRMAKSAEEAAYSAGQQAIIGWISVVFLFFTVVFAGLAAHWAQKAAVAGDKMNKISRDSFEKQLRAYVTIKEASAIFHQNTNGKYEIIANVVFFNCGQTPAYDVAIEVHMDVPERGVIPEFVVPKMDARRNSKIILGPQVVSPVSDQCVVDFEPSSEIGPGKRTIFVWGRCTYRDIYGKEPRCFEFELASERLLRQTSDASPNTQVLWELNAYGSNRAN